MASEKDVVAATATPATVASLTRDLRTLGVADGDIVIVHSSLSALGWVAGGSQAVVEALLAAVGPTGTVVMATQSGSLSDPAGWSNPPVPEAWVPIIREGAPAYDPYLTPTRGVGQIVECFRQHPRTLRSSHPTVSFAANGPAAEGIVGRHPLTPGLGDPSPLGRLYELDAKVLLLGVSHESNTSLHLAETRASLPNQPTRQEGAPVLVDGHRTWVGWDDIDADSSDFEQLGDQFAASGR